MLYYGLTYLFLFVLHIFAAANDFRVFFRIIATMITLQTLFIGLIFDRIGENVTHARIPMLILCTGLGYAYLDMSFTLEIIYFVILGVLIQYGTEKGLKYGKRAENNNG